MIIAPYLQKKQHFEDFDKMGSKVTQGSLEVNLFTPHMSLGSLVLVAKYEVDRAKHARMRAQTSQPNQVSLTKMERTDIQKESAVAISPMAF